MRNLFVQKLDDRAYLPTVANQGEDLGYDIHALNDVFILPNTPTLIHTGIAAVYMETPWYQILSRFLFGRDLVERWRGQKFGLEIEDRSGLAFKFGLHVIAGKIDAGYRGEICVIMMLLGKDCGYQVRTGDRIAQMMPRPVRTSGVKLVENLPPGARGAKGFGSTGR